MVAFYKLGGELVLIKVVVMVPELEFGLYSSCRAGMKGRESRTCRARIPADRRMLIRSVLVRFQSSRL